MKRLPSAAILIVAIALVASSQYGCTDQNTNTASTNANMAVPEPTVDKAAIEAEITRIENDWPRVVKERDGAAVRRIEADDVVLVYPDGSLGNKEQDVKDIEAGNVTADSIEISDIKINVLGKDAAVASLRNTVKNGKFKTPDGKSVDISGQFRIVDTFARRNGQWQLVGSASVKVQAPAPAASPSPSPQSSPAAAASPTMRPSPKPRVSPRPRTSPPPPPAATPQ